MSSVCGICEEPLSDSPARGARVIYALEPFLDPFHVIYTVRLLGKANPPLSLFFFS